jgi:hypothetical protein
MSAVTLSLKGGERFKAQLQQIARSLNTAHAVRIGFLEGASYDSGDGGARLAAAAKRVTPAIAAEHPGWRGLLTAWSRWQASHPGGLSVAQVAFWNEFGTTRAKPRPFFRSAIRRHSGEWGGKLARYLKGAKYDSAVALSKLGLLISEQIVDSIESWPADNAPLTAFIKQFNKSLQDRRTMKDAVNYEVVSK